jgi:hypothetical protein
VSTEIEARARLFDAIEGGSPFWSRQIIEFGASAVVEKIAVGDMTVLSMSESLLECGQLALKKS